MSSYLVLDLETGTKEHLGRTASYAFNDIVAIGLAQRGSAWSYYLPETSEPTNNILARELKDVRILVGHNIKFDLLYIYKFNAFQEWLLAGGKIFDTQLTEYLLSGQQHKYPALRDIAVNKYNCAERHKNIEDYFKQGIDTIDIPKELVIEDVENDVLDTEKVMLQQIKLLKQENMFNLNMEMMEGLLATTEMEWNGMHIDINIFNKNQEKLENELKMYYNESNAIAKNYWR